MPLRTRKLVSTKGTWEHVGPLVRARRQDQTKAESALWSLLRQRPSGLKFRRQHAVGSFIVDSYCVSANLVVEADGSSHDGRDEQDQFRDASLESMGLQVLHLSNEQVLNNPDQTILQILSRERHSCTGGSPSPRKAWGWGEIRLDPDL